MITIILLFCVVLLQQAIIPPDKLPETIAFLLGAFASIITQFVKAKFTTLTARFVFAISLSVIFGVISYFLAKPAETNLVVFVVHVFAYSQLTYTGFWKFIWENALKRKKFGK